MRVFSGTLRPDEPIHISGHLQHFADHLVEEHADHDSDDERVGPLSAPIGDDSRPVGDGIAGSIVIVIAVFTVVAASTVLVPVVGYLIAAEKLRGPLDGLRVWLARENAVIMTVLLLVIGVSLIGKGIAAF